MDDWEQLGFLKNMYDGKIPKTVFQYMALSSIFSQTLDAIGSGTSMLVQERSIDSAFHVFARANVEPGERLDMIEYAYNNMKRVLNHTRTHRIYLRAPPVICYARTRGRSRNSESLISQEYLTCINDHYETWLVTRAHQLEESITLIDATRDIDAITNDVIHAIESLNKKPTPKRLIF